MASSQAPILFSANSSWNLLNFRAPIIRALMDRKLRVAAAVPRDSGAASLGELGVELHYIPIDVHGLSPVRDIRLLTSYFNLMRRVRPSAFLGFTAKPNIYGSVAAARLGIPVLNTVSGLGTAFLSGRALQFLVSNIYQYALRRSERVFFHNADDRNLFLSRKLVRASQTRVVAGSGVDVDRFSPPADPTLHEPPTFLFIGRLLRDKGAKEFAEAASLVLKTKSARFQMLGSADEHPKAVTEEELQPFISAGAIELLGQSDDVRPFIELADCVVLPSYREGLPRVLLEASAMATPVIATDVPGCRHAVEHGRTGLLCSPKSSESLAATMIDFLDMSPPERRMMGHSGREKAVLEFSDEEVVAAYLEALREVGI